jgi:mersacidin/lichenicidin family type 2 lantibiotic
MHFPNPFHQQVEGIMSRKHIIRAWKDEDFRNSLSDQERAVLPEHPAGLIELADTELEAAAGGGFPLTLNCACRTCDASLCG